MGNHPNKSVYVDVDEKAAYAKLIGEGKLITKWAYETPDQALMRRYLRESRKVTPYTREVTVTKKENTHG